jgi:spore photoproduct lyase
MKFSCIYVEKEVEDTARVQAILKRLPQIPKVTISRYGEVFNRRSQNFRLQKTNPALILAKKHGNLVLPAPAGYGFDDNPSFYFSHMLNCVYDCRYCFLQGMYRSANYVLFTNYEDFVLALENELETQNKNTIFYSGYDCDSLALEPISKFIEYFVDWFATHTTATLEVRTKSTQVRSLLSRESIPNCVIAMSFTPSDVSEQWENKVPSIEKRLDALVKLQEQGWPIALRFEPLIYNKDFLNSYERLLASVFSKLNASRIHSISTGLFRMPKTYFKNIVDLYPDEPLYARRFEQQNGLISQSKNLETEMVEIVESLLLEHVPQSQIYRCA